MGLEKREERPYSPRAPAAARSPICNRQASAPKASRGPGENPGILRGSSPRLYPPSLCLKRKSLQKPTFALVTSESRKSHHIETSPRPHRRALSPCSAHHEAGQCPCRGCDRLEDAANGGCGQRESRWRQRKPDLHYQLGEPGYP